MNIKFKFVLLVLFIFLLTMCLSCSKQNNKPQNNKPQNNKPQNNKPQNNKPQNNKPQNNKILKGGDTFINCTLEEVLKHNLTNNKWIYINGNIYDISFVINDDLALPSLFKNINPTNIKTLVNLIKHTDIQDLHQIFKSITDFNTYVNEFKINNPTKTNLVSEFIVNIDTTKTELEQTNQKNEKFNKFKVLFLLSISQFKKGIICPAGLTI